MKYPYNNYYFKFRLRPNSITNLLVEFHTFVLNGHQKLQQIRGQVVLVVLKVDIVIGNNYLFNGEKDTHTHIYI